MHPMHLDHFYSHVPSSTLNGTQQAQNKSLLTEKYIKANFYNNSSNNIFAPEV